MYFCAWQLISDSRAGVVFGINNTISAGQMVLPLNHWGSEIEVEDK